MMLKRLWDSGLVVRISIVVITAIVLAVVFAGTLAPYDPVGQDIPHRLQGPSVQHWFGTDRLGRDELSRMLFGGRLSLTVGLIAIAIEFFFGMLIGLVSGYAGGWVDLAIMRITDIWLGMPGLVFALFIVAVLGPGLPNVMVALGIGSIPGLARVVRGATLAIRERDYVAGSRATGAPPVWVVLRHVVPNVMPPIMVLVTLDVGTIILAAAGLSFIGLGAQPPSPEWGAMLSEARDYFPQYWWMSVFPGAAITLVVLALNIIGDAMRNILDPWLRSLGAGIGAGRGRGDRRE